MRPLLPEHDLDKFLLTANVPHEIQLVANGRRIQYWDNGTLIFDYDDPAPYTRGRFGLRTTFSHVVVKKFRVYRLIS